MKIALIGTGKMGSAIADLAIKHGHEIILKINENSLNLLHPDYLSKADIAIEFTSPDAAVKNLRNILRLIKAISIFYVLRHFLYTLIAYENLSGHHYCFLQMKKSFLKLYLQSTRDSNNRALPELFIIKMAKLLF